MAELEKIQVELSRFEKLHILREELEARKQELTNIGAEVRDKMQIVATQKYLEGLSPYYAAHPREGLPTREEIEELESRRDQLNDLIQNIEATLPTLLEGTEAAAPPAEAGSSQPAGSARKAKFDSFEDFARIKKQP